MLQSYVAQINQFLTSLELPDILCLVIPYIFVYGIVIYLIVSIVLLFGKITKLYTIQKSNGGIFSALSVLGLVVLFATFIPVYEKAYKDQFGGLIPFVIAVIKGLFQIPEPSKKLAVLVLFLLHLILLAFIAGMFLLCFYFLGTVFKDTIDKNGLVVGILVGIYETFAGLFWCAAILAVFAIGTAIVMLPFLIFISTHKIIDDTEYHDYY